MQGKIKYYIESLRLERWPRSLAIFPGYIAAIVLVPENLKYFSTIQLLLFPIAAYFLTLLISTANYIINEIADAPFDAYHPSKKERPLVRGLINSKILLVFWLIIVIFSSVIALIIFRNLTFLLSLAALLIAGILYNVPPVRAKDIPFIDSTLESANNPIRFLIGWLILVENSFPWLLLISWWAFGNFLMVGKRVAEKRFLTSVDSISYRRSLSKYTSKSLFIFMILNALIFIITFGFFAVESGMYTFLFSIPFIIIYLLMFMRKSLQDIDGAEEPEKLLKNPYFALYTLFMVIVFLIAYILK